MICSLTSKSCEYVEGWAGEREGCSGSVCGVFEVLGDPLRTGELAVLKEAIRGSRLAPNGPKEWMIGSFSSSLSEKSRLGEASKSCDLIETFKLCERMCVAAWDG